MGQNENNVRICRQIDALVRGIPSSKGTYGQINRTLRLFIIFRTPFLGLTHIWVVSKLRKSPSKTQQVQSRDMVNCSKSICHMKLMINTVVDRFLKMPRRHARTPKSIIYFPPFFTKITSNHFPYHIQVW